MVPTTVGGARFIIIAGAVACLAACGTTAATPPSAPPATTTPTGSTSAPGSTSPTSRPPATTVPGPPGPLPDRCGVVAGHGVVVDDSGGNSAVTASPGVSFSVVLAPGFTWRAPMSSSPAVAVSDVVRQSSGRLEAELTARQVGRAIVSSTGAVLCPPDQACPALARLWRLQVTVVGT